MHPMFRKLYLENDADDVGINGRRQAVHDHLLEVSVFQRRQRHDR